MAATGKELKGGRRVAGDHLQGFSSNWERIESRHPYLHATVPLRDTAGSNWERIERAYSPSQSSIRPRAATGKELKDTDRGDLHGIRELHARHSRTDERLPGLRSL